MKTSTPENRQEDRILRQCAEQFDSFRRELVALDYFCKGTVLSRMMKCGKTNCACRSDPSARHGPYYELTFKRTGKTINIPLTQDQADVFKAGTREWRRLKNILQRMEGASRRALNRKARFAKLLQE